MSSTNRSAARVAHVADYYVTPPEHIEKFLGQFINDYGGLGGRILDPCAGGDAARPMSYPTALAKFGHFPDTIDLREDSLAAIKCDYLETNLSDIGLSTPDCIITNPPFNLALDVIKKALSDVQDNGYVIMLLRLNFFGSNYRKVFFDEFMPMCSYVHSKRMKFSNTNGTDSIEYMHCVWKKGFNPKSTQLHII